MTSLKAMLPFNEKENFLDKILSTYVSWGSDQVIVVLSPELLESYVCPPELMERLTFVINNHIELERFHSVQIGLQNIMNADYCFIQNVDNPFITEEILDLIHLERNPEEWISPRFKGQGGHPVLLNKKVMDHIRSFPTHEARLDEILNKAPYRKVEMPDDSILININDLNDLGKYKSRMP